MIKGNSSKKLLFSFILFLLFTLAHFGCTPEDTGPGNTPPFIERIIATPDSVTPSDTVILTVDAEDEDLLDQLEYLWEAMEGTLIDPTNEATVTWVAPNRVGKFPLHVHVSDSLETVSDSILMKVYFLLDADILLPIHQNTTHPEDTIQFRARVQGYGDSEIRSFRVLWESDVDGPLDSTAVDSNGYTEFRKRLSYDIHRIKFTAVVNDSFAVSDSVILNNNIPDAVELFDAERGYNFNRLSWTRFNDPTRFAAYNVWRRVGEQGDEQLIARIESGEDTTFTDSMITVGEFHQYWIVAENSFNVGAQSNASNIMGGVFSQFGGTRIGDMTFANDSYYIYLTLPDVDRLEAVDVTANNMDYTLYIGEEPVGLAVDRENNRIFVAQAGDTSIAIIDLNSREWVDTLHLDTQPLYLDYHEPFEKLYVTPQDNNYPFIVDMSVDPVVITEIEDSRLIFDSSLVKIDDIRNNMYLSEIGGFPASLYKYEIGDGQPELLVEDVHNTLGYNLNDFTLTPDAGSILLACESPYQIQIISPLDFSQIGSLNSGPYPNGIAISPNGNVAFSSHSGTNIFVWDFQTRTRIGEFRFADQIKRSSVKVSPDGDYLVVGSFNLGQYVSTISIIYLP